MSVARLRLAPAGETAGFPREPPSLSTSAPQQRLEAAPAMSVAAPTVHRAGEAAPYERSGRSAGDRRRGPRVGRARGLPGRLRLRARRRVPRAAGRGHEADGPVRRDHPRGVRRPRARPAHLRADPDRAVARLDVPLRRSEHALHLGVDDPDPRHGRAAGALPAQDGDGGAAFRLLDDGAARRLGCPGDPHPRDPRGRRLRDHRPEDVGHERPPRGRDHVAGGHRPGRQAAAPGHDGVRRREGAGPLFAAGPGGRSPDQEARVQGGGVGRARRSTASRFRSPAFWAARPARTRASPTSWAGSSSAG